MAKDQQANQGQLMGASAPQQTPSYNPQMGAQANQNAQMAMNAGYRPQQFGLTPQAGMAPTGGPRPFKGNVRGGGPTNARSRGGSPPRPKRPASSYSNFQNALAKYFQQNPGSYQQQRGQGGRPLDSAQLQGPSSFAPGSRYSNRPSSKNWASAIRAGNNRQYGSGDMAQLQGPSSFAANSPYSNQTR